MGGGDCCSSGRVWKLGCGCGFEYRRISESAGVPGMELRRILRAYCTEFSAEKGFKLDLHSECQWEKCLPFCVFALNCMWRAAVKETVAQM